MKYLTTTVCDVPITYQTGRAGGRRTTVKRKTKIKKQKNRSVERKTFNRNMLVWIGLFRTDRMETFFVCVKPLCTPKRELTHSRFPNKFSVNHVSTSRRTIRLRLFLDKFQN